MILNMDWQPLFIAKLEEKQSLTKSTLAWASSMLLSSPIVCSPQEELEKVVMAGKEALRESGALLMLKHTMLVDFITKSLSFLNYIFNIYFNIFYDLLSSNE